MAKPETQTGLTVGDEFDLGPLLQGMTDEPLVAEITGINRRCLSDESVITDMAVSLSYFGISAGGMSFHVMDGKLIQRKGKKS